MKCIVIGLLIGLISGFLYVSIHQTIGEKEWTLKKSLASKYQVYKVRASF